MKLNIILLLFFSIFLNCCLSQNSTDSTKVIEEDPLRKEIHLSYKNSTYIKMENYFEYRLRGECKAFVFDSLLYSEAPFFTMSTRSEFLNDFQYKCFINELTDFKIEPCNDSEPDEAFIAIVENEKTKKIFRLCKKEDLVKYIKLLIKYFHKPIGIQTEMIEKYWSFEK